MRTIQFIIATLCCAWLSSCAAGYGDAMDRNIERAGQTLDSLYKYYSVPGTELLRENYPFDEDYSASYLASEDQDDRPKEFSYLWPFSGTLSAVSALYEATGSDNFLDIIEHKILPGLEEYYDTSRTPYAYASYINSAPASDRFYDDNVWLGIDFTDLYRMTGNPGYLAKAEEIWRFVESGMDDLLGGGIYWCEQKKASKNTCSNAPGAVFALKLYSATGNDRYLSLGKELYEWTREMLLDTADGLYFDHVNLDGTIGRHKFPYNSGQMIQAGVLLYNITGDRRYLNEARETAEASYMRFTKEYTAPDGRTYRALDRGNVWFNAVMIRGFSELYRVDGGREYLDGFIRNTDNLWQRVRDERGLFPADWTGERSNNRRWLLDQAGFIEIFARLGGDNKHE